MIIIGDITFDWDESKNATNQQKHGISFEEALTVFADENAIYFDDPDHSIDEERFLILGLAATAKLCIVSHCYRCRDDIIRIISARVATGSEQQFYFDHFGGGQLK